MHNLVEPNAWIFLRLTSSSLKIFQAVPNTTITLPRYGSFSTNLLLSRPYFLTYELLDRLPSQRNSLLRVVEASEIHFDTIAEEDADLNLEQITVDPDVENKAVQSTSKPLMRSNRNIIDSASRQTLTMVEIEELKKQGTDAGKELIEKLMSNHVGIEQKTSFSLAKYKLLKTKKYLKRFTVLPVDVPLITEWMMEEKDAAKILEIREEMLALIGSWANVHFSSIVTPLNSNAADEPEIGGRWLVVDETGGLLTASIAERMGILYPECHPKEPDPSSLYEGDDFLCMAKTNTITLIHNNVQPNLSLLKYFSFFPDQQNSGTNNGTTSHPLASNLLLVNWLQLLEPEQDTTYATAVPRLTDDELSAMKSSKRAAYHRKLRRWKRAQYVVTQTLRGGFDGLAVVSQMDPVSLLKPLLPLLKGGAQVCIYSPYVEPLVALTDLFSTSRRTAFIQSMPVDHESLLSAQPTPRSPSVAPLKISSKSHTVTEIDGTESIKSDSCSDFNRKTSFNPIDFPLNPTLLLNSTIQSARIRHWQVLPGRTHPFMTDRGGAEGYLFTAVRVLPAEGRVEARGKFSRKRVVAEKQNESESKKLKP